MWIVSYYGGSYDDWYETTLFVTSKKSTATKYVKKFNTLLKKWKDYYTQFEVDDFGTPWIADEHVQKHFDKWNRLRDITGCRYNEIDCR